MTDTVRGTLLRHYEHHPDQAYVHCLFPDHRRETLTYGALVARGSQIAGEYLRAGAGPGSVVIVLLGHSTDLYAAFFGAVLGGQIPAILATPSFKLNAAHYRAEIEALMARIDARAVITDAATAAHLSFPPDRLGRAAILITDRLVPGEAAVPEVNIGAEDVVLLQHSSGSTGLKKGVALSNRAVLNQIEAYAPTLSLSREDHVASWLPLYHDMGLVACCVLPAIAGISVTALSPLHWVTRPVTLMHAISEHRCTLTWLPNFAYEFLAARVRKSELQTFNLESMRGWINCSEPTISTSHRRFLERFRENGVRPETLWTCYAMAETTFAVTQSSGQTPPIVERVERDRFHSERVAVPVTSESSAAVEIMSGGAPLEGTAVRVVDDGRSDLPERHVGEIVIRSTSLFSGYFRDAESTAAVLADGWYYSGDLGYVAGGHVFITGRKKDLIIIAGKNYYPQDIERIVSGVPGVHPGRVVALGHDDASLGTQRLIVLAEVESSAQIESDALTDRIRATLAGELDCVIDDLRLLPHMWLLKTSSGKIARGPNLKRYLELADTPDGHEPSLT